LGGERLGEHLRREDGALEVKGHDAAVGGEIEIEERLVRRDDGAGLVAAGGVDERIDATVAGDDLVTHALEAGAVEHIDGERGGLAGQTGAIGAGEVEFRLVTAEENDAGASGDKVARRRAGENAGGAGDKNHAAGEIEEEREAGMGMGKRPGRKGRRSG